MMMNVPVPYLDVKCYFNVHEDPAGTTWQHIDQYDESIYASVTAPEEVPAWSTTSAQRSHNPLTRLLSRHYKN